MSPGRPGLNTFTATITRDGQPAANVREVELQFTPATVDLPPSMAQLSGQGGGVICADLVEAIELSNLYAPEHLCLHLQEPWRYVGKVKHAGGIFLGEHAYEVLGDPEVEAVVSPDGRLLVGEQGGVG